MIPASIYITEDFGTSYFPDADGRFPEMVVGPENTSYFQVERDFRETSSTEAMPETPAPSPRPVRQSFGAFHQNPPSAETLASSNVTF